MRFFLTLFLTIGLTACDFGESISIKGIDLHELAINGAKQISFEAIVSLGDLKLPNSNSIIRSDHQNNLGELTTEQLDDGTSRLAATISMDKLEQLKPFSNSLLPNSREIPIQGGMNYQIHEISIFENSRIYVGGSDETELMIGLALNLPAFDHILAHNSQNLSIFEDFPLSASIFASAGIFTSPQSGKNGFAIFAKKVFTADHSTKATDFKRSPASSFTDSIKRSPASSFTNDIKKLPRLSFFQLNYLFTKNVTLRVK